METKLFCNPVEKTHDGVTLIGDPLAHLTGYKIKIENEDSADLQVDIFNQFGEQTLLVKESEMIFVPSTKDSEGVFGDLDLDHFKCHKADGFDDLSQDFHFGPGTATVYTCAAPNTRLFALHPAHQLRRQASRPVRPLSGSD